MKSSNQMFMKDKFYHSILIDNWMFWSNAIVTVSSWSNLYPQTSSLLERNTDIMWKNQIVKKELN